MNTLTIKSPVLVITDGDQTLIITDVPVDWVKENHISILDTSITIKAFFPNNSLQNPAVCHIFPAASVISSDLLEQNERLVDQAIKFKPD